MSLRTLGGPLLAFASAAVMLGVIAGLAAYLVSSDTLSSNDDFIVGEYGFGGIDRVELLPTKPLEPSYPFSPYFGLPDGTSEADIEIHGSGSWSRQFVLKNPSAASVREMQKQAEANGLQTQNTQGGEAGFTFSGPDIRGLVQLLQDGPSNTLFVALFTAPHP